MADGVIPTDVEQFLMAHIPSVAHLEALLLLRNEPKERWTVDTLAARLFVPTSQATNVLADLVAHDLAAHGPPGTGTYRYAPATPALATVVDRTAETYRTRLVAVSQLIHARQASRAQQFADAFRIRKD